MSSPSAVSLSGWELSSLVAVALGAIVLYFLLIFVSRKVLLQWSSLPYGTTKKRWEWAYERLGSLVLLYSVAVLVLVPVVFYAVDEETLLGGIIAGIAVVWFIRTQLPSLMPPVVNLVFHHWNAEGNHYEEAAQETDALQADTRSFLIIRVINSGLWVCEECFCSVTVDQLADGTRVRILDQESHLGEYNQVDFAKTFRLQRQNNAAAFVPRDNYQTLHPGDSLFLSVLVAVPSVAISDGEKTFDVIVEVASRSTWFHAKIRRSVTVRSVAAA